MEAKAATCTEAGWNAYEYCTECDYTTKVEIPAGHNLTQVEAKAATCIEAGWNAYEYCTECDYTTKVEIPTINHSGSNNKVFKKTAATCDATGWLEDIYKCKVCESLYIKTDGKTPTVNKEDYRDTNQPPHDYVDGVCTGCGKAEP